jgi:hypothetical protein
LDWHERILGHLQDPSPETEYCARLHAQAFGLKFLIEGDISHDANFRSIEGKHRSTDQLGNHLSGFRINFAWFRLSIGAAP